MALVAHQHRIADQLLAGRSDAVHTQILGHPQLASDGVLDLPGVFPQNGRRIAELGFAVTDVEVYPLGRLPLDDHRVIAGEFQVGARYPLAWSTRQDSSWGFRDETERAGPRKNRSPSGPEP